MNNEKNQPESGSMKAVSAEFIKGRHALMGFIRLLVRDHHAVDDIFQEVWLTLVDALERKVEINDQAKWCRGVARNLARKHWRIQRDTKVIPDSQLLDRIELAFDEHDWQSDYWASRHEALNECVDQLPEHSRRMLTLRYEQGLSIGAMASRLERTVVAATKALSRIRAVLGECVERKLKMELGS